MKILRALRLAATLVPLLAISSLARAGEPGAMQASQTAGEGRVEPDNYDQLHVGDGDRGHAVVPTNQVVSPLGDQIALRGRPTALAISPDRRWLGVLSHDCVAVIDLDAKTVRDSARHPGSFTGIVFAADGTQLFASNMHGTVDAFTVDASGKLKRSWSVRPKASAKGEPDKPDNAVPAGLAVVSPGGHAGGVVSPGGHAGGVVSPGGHAGGTLWAVLNLNNTLAEIELPSGRVLREIPVGNAPFDVALAGGKVYVSNWAGRRPETGDTTGPSGVGPPVRVDPRCQHRCRGVGLRGRSGPGPGDPGNGGWPSCLRFGCFCGWPFHRRGLRQRRYGCRD